MSGEDVRPPPGTAPRTTGELLARSAVAVGLVAGLIGGLAGLVVGLVTYPPTAWFAVLELGVPAGVVGAVLGLAAGVLAAVFRRTGTSGAGSD